MNVVKLIGFEHPDSFTTSVKYDVQVRLRQMFL